MTEPARLLAFAARLRERIDGAEAFDGDAYASLHTEGDRQPWTGPAEQMWARGGGPWRVHHLAIALHAHAYDLELAGDTEAAIPYWRGALGHWATLYHDSAFWDRMHEHLETVTGTSIPAETVQAVRERLPRDLLAPHLSLAGELRLSDPRRARAHIDLVRASGLPPSAVARARAELVRDAITRAGRDIEEGRHDDAVELLASWLAVDPTGPDLARTLLYVSRHHIEIVVTAPGWAAGIAPLVERVARLVRPAWEDVGTPEGTFAVELARHEYWRAIVVRERESGPAKDPTTRDEAATRSGGHFLRAMELDRDINLRSMYRDIEQLAAQEWALAATARKRAGGSDAHTREALRRACAMSEPGAWGRLFIARALIDLDSTTPDDLALARRLADEVAADPDATHPDIADVLRGIVLSLATAHDPERR